MLLKFKDILPNPNRDLVRNPLNEDKVAKLVASINSTGFWDNVVVRKNSEGRYELAYGHSRLESAKRAGLTEANFIVKKFSDAEMIKVMKAENDEAYGFVAASLLESVRAVVRGLAEGKIEPFWTEATLKEKRIKISGLRYAPSFIVGDDRTSRPTMAYTTLNVAEFLEETVSGGEKGRKASLAISAAVSALELIEQQELSEAALKNLPLDGGKTGKGFIQKLREATERRESRLALMASQKQLAEADEKRREDERKDKEKQTELRRIAAEATKEEDEKKAKEVTAEIKRVAEQAEKRNVAFKASRAALDAKVKENEERAELAKKADKDLPIRHAVRSALNHLGNIITERNAFRDTLRELRSKAITQAERENIRQALLAASSWYDEQAIAFRPVGKVDVLKELRQREEAKHKRENKSE